MSQVEVTWDDVGRREAPGIALVRGMQFRVEQKHIDAWLDDPDGTWTVKELTASGQTHWILNSFHESDLNG
jgi:hypothetical protein